MWEVIDNEIEFGAEGDGDDDNNGKAFVTLPGASASVPTFTPSFALLQMLMLTMMQV